MNLHGSLTELQNKVAGFYLKLEQRFRENKVISELWGAMASDVSQQVKSLAELSPSFWNALKKAHDFSEIASGIGGRISENLESRPLQSCFEHTLSLEEPIILKIYVPVLKSLRENWTDQALDFYIVVKAHLARINRVMQAYSGDPVTLQRSNLLLQQFEKEVQEPQVGVQERASPWKPVRDKKTETKTRTASKRDHPLTKHVTKHAQSHRERSKPMGDKMHLRRRRARR